MPKDVVEIAQKSAAARQHDALVDDVGGELRRRVLERDLDRLDDGADRLGETLGDLPLADDDLLGHAVHQIAALDLHDAALAVLRHAGRADLLLDALGARLADQKIMVAADISDDRLRSEEHTSELQS